MSHSQVVHTVDEATLQQVREEGLRQAHANMDRGCDSPVVLPEQLRVGPLRRYGVRAITKACRLTMSIRIVKDQRVLGILGVTGKRSITVFDPTVPPRPQVSIRPSTPGRPILMISAPAPVSSLVSSPIPVQIPTSAPTSRSVHRAHVVEALDRLPGGMWKLTKLKETLVRNREMPPKSEFNGYDLHKALQMAGWLYVDGHGPHSRWQSPRIDAPLAPVAPPPPAPVTLKQALASDAIFSPGVYEAGTITKRLRAHGIRTDRRTLRMALYAAGWTNNGTKGRGSRWATPNATLPLVVAESTKPASADPLDLAKEVKRLSDEMTDLKSMFTAMKQDVKQTLKDFTEGFSKAYGV